MSLEDHSACVNADLLILQLLLPLLCYPPDDAVRPISSHKVAAAHQLLHAAAAAAAASWSSLLHSYTHGTLLCL